MKTWNSWICLLVVTLVGGETLAAQPPQDPTLPFVVQLTRTSADFGHRRVMLQLDKVLDDLGEAAVHFTVVAYEEGIHALLSDNQETAQLVTKLAHRGVVFKACRISMRAWQITDDDFPLEVEFIDAGAPEVVRLQMVGYRYWRP